MFLSKMTFPFGVAILFSKVKLEINNYEVKSGTVRGGWSLKIIVKPIYEKND